MHIGLISWYFLAEEGGVQQSTRELCAFLSSRGHDVTVFFCEGKAAKTGKPPENIRCVPLKICSGTLPACRELLRAARLDVLAVLGLTKPLPWIPLLTHGLDIPLLISERIPKRILDDELIGPYLHNAALTAADGIHILSAAFVGDYPEYLRELLHVIPNPCICPSRDLAVRYLPRPEKEHKILFAFGRHDENQKNFSMLLDAFAMLTSAFPDWRLFLGGTGKASPLYKARVASLGIENSVRLIGEVKENKQDLFLQADLFCTPSRFEGFGRVTCEAHSYGLPVVGFAECPGTNSLIRHGENGLLAPKFAAEYLAAALLRLMASPALREEMGRNALRAAERYAPETILPQWETMLLAIAAHKGNTRLDAVAPVRDAEESARIVLSELLRRESPLIKQSAFRTHGNIAQLQTKIKETKAALKKKQRRLLHLWLRNLVRALAWLKESIQHILVRY